MRSFVALTLALTFAPLAFAAAQDTTSPPPEAAPAAEAAPPPAEAVEAAPPPDTSTSPPPRAEEEVVATPRPADPPPPPVVPPVMIVVLSTGRVPEDVIAAAQSALVTAVTPLAGGRPVLPLAMPEMRDRLAACTDAACQGAFLGESGAIGAIIVRLSRRAARGPVAMTVDMIDPVSGAPRLAQISGSLVDAAGAAAVLGPIVEQLRAVMFSPPPPPPQLLVTVNVDGATVMIDGESVGESPISSQRLTRGHHVVMVTRTGYSGTRRELDLEPGDQERLDISLLPLATSERQDDGTFAAAAPEPPWYEQWYVWAGIGGGVLVIAGVIIGVVIAVQPSTPPDPVGFPIPRLSF